MSLSLSTYTNTTYTQKMDSLLPRVSRDSKASVSPSSLSLEPGNTIKSKEWRRLTAIDYLSKVVTVNSPVSVDRDKPLPHRPISVVGSVHSHVSVEDVVGQGVSPPPLALAAISEEDLEGGAGALSTCDADEPSPRQRADEDDGEQADTEKDVLPITPRASSNHRRSMTLPLQAMPHLNLALGLSSSPSLGSSKAGEVSLQAEKDGHVFSKSGQQVPGEANTNTEDSPELRPTSDIPHITALAELAASIVGEHPDASPILERVASLTMASSPPSSLASSFDATSRLFDITSSSRSFDTTSWSLDTTSRSFDVASTTSRSFFDPTSTTLSNSFDPTATTPSNYKSLDPTCPTPKFPWAGNTHRTTFGLVARANVPPTPPRLAMFVGVGSGDGGDVGFRSNAGSVVRVAAGGTGMGQKQKSLGAGTGIVLVQTSLDLGKGNEGVRASASPNGNLAGNATANANANSTANGNANTHATANANVTGSTNANGNSNAAASPNGNPLANTNANPPLANANPNTTANPNATSSPNANANSTVIGSELLEKEKEAVSEVHENENESESEGQVEEGQIGSEGQVRKEGQVEKEDQMGKDGQVEQEEQVAMGDQVEKEEQVATGDVAGKTKTGDAIGKTSTSVQPGTTTTTTTGRPPAPVQSVSRPSGSAQISSRLPTPVQSARLAVPLRPTRGKENRYLGGEPPRSVRRPPSHLRNVLCAI